MKKKKVKKLFDTYQNTVDHLMNASYNKSSSKRKKKYHRAIDDDESIPDLCDVPDPESLDCCLEPLLESNAIPPQLVLNTGIDPGICFGYISHHGFHQYVGMRQGTEGNLVIIGGPGSRKSAGIIKPTLFTWEATMCVTDVKGELSSYYKKLYQYGYVKRPYIIFDPLQTGGTGYDFFYWVTQDEKSNVPSNISEIASALIPTPSDDKDRFWIESEQSILAAALLYYYNLGRSFKEAVTLIMSSTVAKLSEEISEGEDMQAKMLLGQTSDLKPEQMASIDRGIRNKLSIFATDEYISKALRSTQSDTNCFTWDDIEEKNIFLCIPAIKIEQWGGLINLMYTQLIRHLERRPEKYSPEGVNNMQTLLILDEFARFGKLEMITHALATLRSKNVNICLVVQSLAQLDKTYGECDRRIILDTCQFQAVLQANDADTQEYISRLIGTHPVIHRGKTESYDDFMEFIGYSNQFIENREYIVFPHELSTLTDVLLITPYGFCRADKLLLTNNLADNPLLPERIIFPATTEIITSSPSEPLQIDTWYQLDDKGTLIRDPVDSQNNETLRVCIKSVKLSASTGTNEIP